MELCPLTKHWCVFCGSPHDDPVCYEGAEIKKVRDLKACPQMPFLAQGIDGDAEKQPA